MTPLPPFAKCARGVAQRASFLRYLSAFPFVVWVNLVLFVVGLTAPARPQSAQSFDSLTCRSAIAKELLGRTMPNGRVSVIESRYRHLSLANQGAFGLEIEGDPWTLVSWKICGREHVILERNGVVRDVLVAPAEAAQSKSVIVSCSVDGVQAMKTAVVFSPADGWRAPSMVSRVWLIDDQEVRFVERSGAGIRCTELGA